MADTKKTIRTEDTASRFRKLLNTHGHAFQARVQSECNGAVINDGSGVSEAHRWQVSGTEVPVQVNGQDHHIDFVLQLHSMFQEYPTRFIVVECKRADPAVAEWCFALRDSDPPKMLISQYNGKVANGHSAMSTVTFSPGHDDRQTPLPVAHIGFELKGNETGDGTGKVLDQALNQVIRGTSGLINRLPAWLGPDLKKSVFVVFPLIVTTARLFVADRPLSGSDLHTGLIDSLEVRPANAVWLDVHASRSMLPDEDTDWPRGWGVVERAVRHAHRRSVLIANVAGLSVALRTMALTPFYECQ